MKSWGSRIEEQKSSPLFCSIQNHLSQLTQNGIPWGPNSSSIFHAFDLTPFEKTKIVVIGQDPYHGKGEANGLAFSVNNGIPIPPSLRNIFKELEQSVDGFRIPRTGDLTSWARQGVLLINTVLTVELNHPRSHTHLGWQQIVLNLLNQLCNERKKIIFMQWGNDAKRTCEKLNLVHQYKLIAPHPSPLSAWRGFFGCNHFVEANKILKENQESLINWCL